MQKLNRTLLIKNHIKENVRLLMEIFFDRLPKPIWTACKDYFNLKTYLKEDYCLRWHPTVDSKLKSKIQCNSLLWHCKNIYSQRGDDGIIRKIFEIMGIKKGFFVEFGAWDGIFLSNCRQLFSEDWDGVFIEASERKFNQLSFNYKDFPNIICVNEFVAHAAALRGRTIDEIAQEYFPRREIDLLVIDIDGLDYKIFESMDIRPKVVCIEGGFPWHPQLKNMVPDNIACFNLQQPLSVIIEIGKKKGYEAVCFNQNTYFVRKEFHHLFSNIENDPLILWMDAWYNETDEFRAHLLDFRRRNSMIIEIEEKHNVNYEILDI